MSNNVIYHSLGNTVYVLLPLFSERDLSCYHSIAQPQVIVTEPQLQALQTNQEAIAAALEAFKTNAQAEAKVQQEEWAEKYTHQQQYIETVERTVSALEMTVAGLQDTIRMLEQELSVMRTGEVPSSRPSELSIMAATPEQDDRLVTDTEPTEPCIFVSVFHLHSANLIEELT